VRVLLTMLDALIGAFDGFFVYKTNKAMVVDIWQIGLFYRALQAAIFAYILFSLVNDNQWAYAEQPVGDFNMYVSGGSSASIIGAATDFDKTFKYCGNSSYSYDYSAEYQYGSPPKCRELSTGEATVKDTKNFFFVTMFDERHTLGWSCDGADAASQYQKCLDLAANNSPELGSGDLPANIVSKTRGNQCTCNVRESYYPVAVEHMVMAMEISYGTSNLFGSINGSTNNPNPTLGPNGRSLEVRFYNNTGHNLLKNRYEAPQTSWVAFSLKDMLGAVDLDLDQENSDLTPDYRTTGTAADPYRYPKFRTAGVNLQMQINFVNSDPIPEQERRGGAPTRLRALFSPHDVRAEVEMKPNVKQWAGLGPIMHYEQFPSGPGGNTFHKVERYRQGVVISFVTVGHVMRFDIKQLVLQLVIGLSLLAAAKTVTETIGYRVCVNKVTSSMIKAKAKERITATSEFAELGMKAAIAATQYARFDPDGNRRIELVDIAVVFAKIEGVTPLQAYTVAEMVMQGGDQDFQLGKPKLLQIADAVKAKFGKEVTKKTGDASAEGLDFYELVTCVEGDAVNFKKYINELPVPPDVDQAKLATIEEAFANEGYVKPPPAADEPSSKKSLLSTRAQVSADDKTVQKVTV